MQNRPGLDGSPGPPTSLVDIDREISDDDIEVIAREHLERWEGLPLLTRAEETVIRNSSPSDYFRQKREFLYKWKERHGNKATYRELSNAAAAIGNQALADTVNELGRRALLCKYILYTKGYSKNGLRECHNSTKPCLTSHPYLVYFLFYTIPIRLCVFALCPVLVFRGNPTPPPLHVVSLAKLSPSRESLASCKLWPLYISCISAHITMHSYRDLYLAMLMWGLGSPKGYQQAGCGCTSA